MTPTRKLGAGIQISAEQAIPVFLRDGNHRDWIES